MARQKTLSFSLHLRSVSAKSSSTDSLDVLCVLFHRHQLGTAWKANVRHFSSFVLIAMQRRKQHEKCLLRPLNFIYFNNKIITLISNNQQWRWRCQFLSRLQVSSSYNYDYSIDLFNGSTWIRARGQGRSLRLAIWICGCGWSMKPAALARCSPNYPQLNFFRLQIVTELRVNIWEASINVYCYRFHKFITFSLSPHIGCSCWCFFISLHR